MKNVFLLLVFIFSTSLFSQNKFDGKWIRENDEYILYINTKTNEIYSYSSKYQDTLREKIISKNSKQITTNFYYKNQFIDTYQYLIIKNNLQVKSLSLKSTDVKSITIYKKQ